MIRLLSAAAPQKEGITQSTHFIIWTHGVHLHTQNLELKGSWEAGCTNDEYKWGVIGVDLYTSLPLLPPLFFKPNDITDVELN